MGTPCTTRHTPRDTGIPLNDHGSHVTQEGASRVPAVPDSFRFPPDALVRPLTTVP